LPYTSISRSCYTKSILRPQIRPVNRELNLQLCGTVTALLNGAGIGNLLWGANLQAVYTVPTVILVSFLTFDLHERRIIADIWELSFVVAGNQLQKAVTILESKGFLLCRDKSCSLNTPRDCQGQSFDNPHAQFHLDILLKPTLHKNCNILRLDTMEDKLWELPVFEQDVNSQTVQAIISFLPTMLVSLLLLSFRGQVVFQILSRE
jgi:hypothetical protein